MDALDLPGTFWVTSHLVVGDVPTRLSGRFREVATAAEAVAVVSAGDSAVLPANRFDLAADVLRLFGADEDHVRSQLHLATAGLVPGL